MLSTRESTSEQLVRAVLEHSRAWTPKEGDISTCSTIESNAFWDTDMFGIPMARGRSPTTYTFRQVGLDGKFESAPKDFEEDWKQYMGLSKRGSEPAECGLVYIATRIGPFGDIDGATVRLSRNISVDGKEALARYYVEKYDASVLVLTRALSIIEKRHLETIYAALEEYLDEHHEYDFNNSRWNVKASADPEETNRFKLALDLLEIQLPPSNLGERGLFLESTPPLPRFGLTRITEPYAGLCCLFFDFTDAKLVRVNKADSENVVVDLLSGRSKGERWKVPRPNAPLWERPTGRSLEV